MKCCKCGTEISDSDAFCSVCGAENLSKYFDEYKTKRNLILSIFTAVLCCIPFGIAGVIINEYKVKPAILNHDFDSAKKSSNIIFGFQIAGIILGSISIMLRIISEISSNV